jgi:nucleotide-binding universal stress UspA family protein
MPVIDAEADSRGRGAERDYMIKIRERLGPRSELPTRIAVMDGPVETVLATFVELHAIDLIVMATHGRRGLARAWLGSVGDALLRSSRVPVLLVRASEETALDTPERPRILIPLDGSRLSERVLEPAMDLGRSLSATYRLVRVVTHAEDEARDYLSRIGGWMQDRGLEVDTTVVPSEHPALAILEESERAGAALIAMATHGRHGVPRLVMGSVAGGVLRGARVPLLLYRPKMEERGLEMQAAAVGAAS